MAEGTTTGFTPRWKDDKGNRLIFPAGNTLFDNLGDASDFRSDQFLFMIPFGLVSDGIFEFEHRDGKFQIPHAVVRVGLLGDGIVIEGPILEAALAEEGA